MSDETTETETTAEPEKISYFVTAKSQILQKVAAKEDSRYAMGGVHFNERFAVATDGHRMLVALKSTSDLEPSNVTIAFDSPAQKNGHFPSESYLPVGSNGTIVGQLNAKHTGEILTGQFPDYEKVLPKFAKSRKVITLAFNTKYLVEMAAALNHGESDKTSDGHIAVTFQQDAEGNVSHQMLITGKRTDAFGILMPLRWDTASHCVERMERVLAVEPEAEPQVEKIKDYVCQDCGFQSDTSDAEHDCTLTVIP